MQGSLGLRKGADFFVEPFLIGRSGLSPVDVRWALFGIEFENCDDPAK